MSTLYNRRRGAKSYRPRKPRTCPWVDKPYTASSEINALDLDLKPCGRICDTVSQLCSDHRR